MVTTVKQFTESFPSVVCEALIEYLKIYGITSEKISLNGEVGIAMSETINGKEFASPRCPR